QGAAYGCADLSAGRRQKGGAGVPGAEFRWCPHGGERPWSSAGVAVGARGERGVAGEFARSGRAAVAGGEDPGGGVWPGDGGLQRYRAGLRGRDEVRDSTALLQ